MFISDTAINQRTTVFVLTIILVLAGLFCYFELPRESVPEVIIPYVFISTGYRGVSSEDMESSVTKKIEDKLKGLENVNKITSTSSEGRSEIIVEFVEGADIDDAIQKVKDKVDLAKPELPSNLDDDPDVYDINFSEMPIFVFALSGPSGLKELRDIGEDLEEQIEGIPGVLEVDVVGGLEREIHIEVDPDRMTLYGVPFTSLFSAVQQENANVSGGSVRTGEGKYQIRLEGEFTTVEDVEGLVLMTRGDDSPVYLRDIAAIKDGFKDRQTDSRLDGFDSVTLYVKKRSGENVIEIIDEANALLDRERQSWPAGTVLTILEDRSDEIRFMISDLENNIISGLLLVIIVICIVMGFRNAVLVSLSIPLSMLLGFIVLKTLDITLNMVVLFSLTLALGMLVDNAIVIIENIFRFMQNGVPRMQAAKRATGQVARPIIASALTTIAAFTPLLWWGGIMGDFMVYLPITVITVLVSCLFVALVINPAIAAVLMRIKAGQKKEGDFNEDAQVITTAVKEGLIIRTYKRMLRAALGMDIPHTIASKSLIKRGAAHLLPLFPRFSVLALALMALVFAVSFWVYRVGLRTPVEFFPSVDPDRAVVTMEMLEGADLDYCNIIAKEAEMRVFDKNAYVGADGTAGISYQQARRQKKHSYQNGDIYSSPSDIEDVETSFARVDSQTGNNSVTFLFPEIQDRTKSSALTLKEIAERIKGLIGCKLTVDEPEHGPPTGAPINIEIIGEDMAVLGKMAKKVQAQIRQVPFVRNITDDFVEGSPTLRVRVNRKKAMLLGLSTQDIGFALNAAINGIEVSEYRDGDDDYDIIARIDNPQRRMVETLRRIFLPSATHGAVPLTTVAKIEYTGGLGDIHRIDHNRVVTVKAEVDETKTTGATARMQAERLLAGSPLFTQEVLFQEDKTLEDWRRAVQADDSVEKLAELAGVKLVDASTEELAAGLNAIVKNIQWDGRLEALDTLLAQAALTRNPDHADDVEKARMLAGLSAGDPEAAKVFNRALLEILYPAVLAKSKTGLELPPGYRYSFTGEHEFQKEAEDFLLIAGFIAVCLIFLILVAQFNSIIYPFIILSSVVLSLTGVFLGLGIVNFPFGVIMTGVGVISLAGVVVNNAIVLIDYILLRIRQGMKRDEAILTASATRLRPVLLTAVTTVLGLIPMATGISWDFHWSTFGLQTVSETTQYWRSMAVAVIFGLLTATLLTLFVVPVLFSLLDDLGILFMRIMKKLARALAALHNGIKTPYWRWVFKHTGITPRPGEPGYEKQSSS